MQVVRFYSGIESRESAVVTPVVNAETDLLTVWSPDYEPLVPASVGGNTQATLQLDFTLGSLTNGRFKIYGTPDPINRSGGVRWFPVTVATYTAGAAALDDLVVTLTATGKKAFEFGVGAWKGVKITSLSTGTVTSSSVTAIVSLRTN